MKYMNELAMVPRQLRISVFYNSLTKGIRYSSKLDLEQQWAEEAKDRNYNLVV